MKRNPIHSSFRAESRSLLEKCCADDEVSHPGLRGDATESLIRDFLRKHLPRRFEPVCGCAIGSGGDTSAQTDVIVYDSMNSPRPPTTTDIIPVESVVSAVEVKTTLRNQLIPKACADAAKLKALTRNQDVVCQLSPDGVATPLPSPIPICTQVSLLGFFSNASIESLARTWHRHYCDVPFGHQIDCIASIQSGFITVGCWHPSRGYARNQISNVYGLFPGHECADGISVLLFPDLLAKDWNETRRVRVGPRVPWEVGSALFICANTCNDFGLYAWFVCMLEHIRFQIRSSSCPSLGHFADVLPPNSTLMLPLAIAVDPERLQKERESYVAKATVHLMHSEFSADDVRKLERER